MRLQYETSTKCGAIRVGDYLVVEGSKQNEFVFDAEEVSVESAVLR